MKKRIIALIICVISVLSIAALSACSESCIKLLLKPKTPTVKSVRESINKTWEVDLPQNITLTNYALDIGRDSKYYYVFDYNGNDETFNALLSSEKNEEFEQKFLGYSKPLIDDFIKEYTLPDLSEDYLWTLRTIGEDKRHNLFVLYIPSENQLIVYESF